MSSANDYEMESIPWGPNTMTIDSSLNTPQGSFSQSSAHSALVEKRRTQGAAEQMTPRNSRSPPRGALSAFGVNTSIHLPTPESMVFYEFQLYVTWDASLLFAFSGAEFLFVVNSPSNVESYGSAIPYVESPLPSKCVIFPIYNLPLANLRRSTYHSQPPSHHTFHYPPTAGERAEASQPFLTPESSPLYPGRTMRSQGSLSAAEGSPVPVTPRPSSKAEIRPDMGRQSASGPLLLSSPFSHHVTPSSSRLSSPFVERSSLGERPSSKARSIARSYAMIPDIRASPQLPLADDLFSLPKSPPPLSVPIPKRAAGGEIERIRLQMAADNAARLQEMEARRPDYLVRERRPRSTGDPATDLARGEGDQGNGPPGLGVTESPAKGRRLQLFQETSDETFEQSLLAGGYPGYGSTQSAEPQTPVNKGKDILSHQALQWLQQVTPGQASPGQLIPDADADRAPSEKEVRKRKRLAAFEDCPESMQPPAKLHPREIEEMGRIVLYASAEEPPPFVTPQKKRTYNRRKKRGGSHGAGSKRHGDPLPDDTELQGPNWLDTVFPWCVRSQERTEDTRAEKEERLKRIERYLDRVSDGGSDEDESAEDQVLRPAVYLEDEEVVPRPRGRGKMVPLKANPLGRPSELNNMYVPSDPADARAALLSKRSVRALAFRRRRSRRRIDDDEDSLDGGVLCVCGREDDGGSLVQCDECRSWYHFGCVGVVDTSELGAEEDPWFCPDCLGVIPSSDPLSEPTFVPTDYQLPVNGKRDPLFYQMQQSPSTPWSFTRTPKTPNRGRDLTQTHSSLSSWDSSQEGPSTPDSHTRGKRIFTTPGQPGVNASFDSPFDPTTTPSHSSRSRWAEAQTAKLSSSDSLSSWRGISIPWSLINGDPGRSPFRNIYTSDDTPISRSGPRSLLSLASKSGSFGSPLASQSSFTGALKSMLEESPGKKGADIEHSKGLSREESLSDLVRPPPF
ncbi:uncharacterized protein FIBRA_00326 [Fibroporia radiculosa]|uniref:PHD-type domain-containing protein n=1 Tax=Fibroporia radiculosa TaxID=599839 RepID=J7RGW9_9APHY|nr:uncharacterized protein FIBRA_00326 [Fibroporia radiculosa]CCL98332.1 predicted protein [Fibroporia radiculosa]